jgi:hypothetical protein
MLIDAKALLTYLETMAARYDETLKRMEGKSPREQYDEFRAFRLAFEANPEVKALSVMSKIRRWPRR